MMRVVNFYILVISAILLLYPHSSTQAQSVLESNNLTVNRAGLMLNSDSKLNIGGYGQVDYNQPVGNGNTGNGKLDVHRIVLLFGYRFTNKLSFVTEIEVEHVSEVYIEQAFFNYAFNTYFSLRGGLMLIPMGIINEYHEPPTFNGVERPLIDKYIAPTTWREIGIGATGTIPEVSMRYQAYLVNGFKSYADGRGYLDGSNGLRKGRQKGAESMFFFPSVSARLEYYGILGLNIGLSGYFGKTQSSKFNAIERQDNLAVASADSSVVGISMVGADVRYNRKGLVARAQVYYTSISNTRQYNYFTTVEGQPNDLGSSMYGYYVEFSYNLFKPVRKIKSELIPFIRFSQYDTQATVDSEIGKDSSYQTTAITVGIGYWFISQLALKTDVQFLKKGNAGDYKAMFNAGIAVMF
ncbi:MAG: hypothetical protein P8100_05820 [bacterium]